MIHTKRYLAAAGDKYYPRDNLQNIVGLYDTVDEALEAAQASDIPGCKNCGGLAWVCVYDLLRMVVVAYGDDDGPNGEWVIFKDQPA